MHMHLLTVSLVTASVLVGTQSAPIDTFESIQTDVIAAHPECSAVFSSQAAKFQRENFVLSEARNAFRSAEVYESSQYQTKSQNIDMAAYVKYSDRIANPNDFSPVVENIKQDAQLTCVEICHKCVPGSVPIHLLRNPQFASMGQTCLCTYSESDPVGEFAFEIRNEREL